MNYYQATSLRHPFRVCIKIIGFRFSVKKHFGFIILTRSVSSLCKQQNLKDLVSSKAITARTHGRHRGKMNDVVGKLFEKWYQFPWKNAKISKYLNSFSLSLGMLFKTWQFTDLLLKCEDLQKGFEVDAFFR